MNFLLKKGNWDLRAMLYYFFLLREVKEPGMLFETD